MTMKIGSLICDTSSVLCVGWSTRFSRRCVVGGRFAPLRRSLIGDTTHYLQGAAVLTGLLYHVVLYHVDSRARLAGSGAQGD